ncbi:MAG TPA: hypothetical protein VGK74_17570 [Symbiobacteriaceae bacterium]|jgi:hypothetical protein
MFAPYTPLDQCIGREVKVRVDGEAHVGMLTGIYTLNGQTVLVIVPLLDGAGSEQHIPLHHAVVTVKT